MRNTLGAAALLILLVTSAHAEPRAETAGTQLALAESSARAWADDARLVYVENDARVSAEGRSRGWGYLFHSASRDAARAYSIEDGKVERAADLEFDFAAPIIEGVWIDSSEALAQAEKAGGASYRSEHDGRLRTTLLVRGVMHVDDPGRTTWTCVYDAPGVPSLWIVLDAGSGDVLRKWQG